MVENNTVEDVYRRLHQYGLELMRHTEFQPLLEDVIAKACTLAGSEDGFIYMMDADHTIHSAAATGIFAPFVGDIHPLQPEGIVGHVIETGESFVVYDYDNWHARLDYVEKSLFYSIVGLPLCRDARVIGVAAVAYVDPTRRFSESTLQLLNDFAEMASLSLDKMHEHEQLQTSQQFIERITELVPVGLYMLNIRQQRTIYMNQGIADILGYPLDVLQSQRNPLKELVHPDDEEGVLQKYVQLRHIKDRAVEMEYRVKHGDGHWIWIRNVANAVEWDANGQATASVGSVHDVTERYETLEALRAKEAQLSVMFEESGIGIVLTRRNGVLEYVNRQFCHMVGYQQHELLGMHFSALTHPDDYVEEQRYIDQMRAWDRTSYTIEKRYTRKNGDYVWGRMTTSRVQGAEDVEYIAFIEDLTSRRKTEAALNRSEQRFEAIFESAAVGIATAYLDGTINLVNDTLASMVGYTVDEMRGMKVQTITHPDDMEREWPLVEDLTNGVRAWYQIEKRHLCKDGGIIWVRVTVSMIHNRTEVIAIVEDITEYKRNEEAKLALAVQRERMEILAGFIKNAGHDFRNPLAVINTSLHLLSRTEDPEKRKVRMDMIADRVRHLNRLVDALLIMVRHDTNAPMTLQRMDINQVLKDKAYDIEETTQKHNLNFVVELSETSLYILASGQDLNVALNNIVDNAIAYTSSPGTITLRTYKDDDRAVIEISDTGEGIGIEDLPHIFDRFYRGARGQEEGGLGLGLAISHKIIERHGGEISVASVYGEGSTFTVRLLLTD